MSKLKTDPLKEFLSGRGEKPRKVVVGMSGGVDSSYTAWALKESQIEVVGVFLDTQLGGQNENSRDAALVAQKLGIPFHIISIASIFEKEVLDPFIRDYTRGLTPNPCVICNPRVKFKTLIEKADEIGADTIATGHHARVRFDPETGKVSLLRGVVARKDQSYFLGRLTPEVLSRCIFPVGWRKKSEVRETMEKEGIHTFNRPESQDICFTDVGGHINLIEERLGSEKPLPGDIVNHHGKILGKHSGVYKFTVGQRKGLGISSPEPLYVLSINADKNQIIVGPMSMTFSDDAVIDDLNWISDPPSPEEKVKVKVRYRSKITPAKVSIESGNKARICFSKPQRAITPGQSAVIYRGGEVLGAGVFLRKTNNERS